MNTFSATKTLVTFVEVETGLMDLAVASRFSKRQITDAEMRALAEKFWSAYYQDNFKSTQALEQVFADVNELGNDLDPQIWMLVAEAESGRKEARAEIYMCEEMELALREEMEQESSGFDAEAFSKHMDESAKRASKRCGCIYEVYQRSLSGAIDSYIATLPAAHKQEALALARHKYDYLTAEEIAEEISRDQEAGLCSHGLDPDCCPCGCGDLD
ncbi:TPA: hypothetical protein MN540_005069 [Klebsiella pneumoniae]|nr:hypothetical protein [Klebsiella pneumoniae]